MCFIFHVVDENIAKLFEFRVAVLCFFVEDSLRIFVGVVAEIGLGTEYNTESQGEGEGEGLVS